MKLKCIPLLVCACFVVSTSVARDFGNAVDVKEVRKVVAAKFGHPLHASVAQDWALCTAYTEHSDLSVVLHRTAPKTWEVVQSDGGAFVAETLKDFGVPMTVIPDLLKAYQ
ncbi:MAG: hypothetical protein JO354_01225 [Verrucomicrobia bacterium]|nr:hypothetical protein [Verrucomicrobiota bacterium]